MYSVTNAYMHLHTPPWWLRNGLEMTVYTALWLVVTGKVPLKTRRPYKETIFIGAGGVPIFGWVAIPENPRSTIVGTYGITGCLDNQWFLRILGRKAFAQGYAVVLARPRQNSSAISKLDLMACTREKILSALLPG